MRKRRAHALGHRVPPRLVGAVHLGDQRRKHRRPRRHLDDLDLRAELRRNSLQCGPGRRRNVVALPVAVVLVDQIDLQIAIFRILSQVVLANQPVEIDRRRRPGVCLVVGDLGDRRNVVAQRVQDAGGALDRRAGRHVDDDLEFGLVVERQHLQHDPFQARERQRQGDRDADAGEQQTAVAPSPARIEKGIQQPREPGAQPGVQPRAGVRGDRMRTGETQREPRRHDERDRERDQHAHAGVDRDRAHVRSHQAA